MKFEESKMISHLEKIYPFYPKGCQNPEAMESGYELGYTAGQESMRPLVEKMREALESVVYIIEGLSLQCPTTNAKAAIAEADKFLKGE